MKRWKNYEFDSTSSTMEVLNCSLRLFMDTKNIHLFQAVININQLFYHYEDSPTYKLVKLWADLGGYLGLMLGYCAYNVADLINYLWELKGKRETEALRQQEPT